MGNKKIAVIGLGYVGLPLAVEFGKKYDTIGFDINAKRVAELENFNDRTLETTTEDLKSAMNLKYTCNLEDLKAINILLYSSNTDRQK